MKKAFLFSGQGAQYSGMIKDIYDSCYEARRIFDIANETLNRDISRICFFGNQVELKLTHNTQPCMLAVDLAVAEVLKGKGVEPDAVAGFSLGEYAALVQAEVLDIRDAFRLVQFRANEMQEAVPLGKGSMAAIMKIHAGDVETLCRNVKCGYVIAANYNSPLQTIISGEIDAVIEVVSLAKEMGATCKLLEVSAPFHCSLMRDVTEKLSEKLQTITLHDARIPVYMNVNAQPVKKKDEIAELLIKQVESPVRWADTLLNLKKDGVDTFVECGPGKTLTLLTKKTLNNINTYRTNNINMMEKTINDII